MSCVNESETYGSNELEKGSLEFRAKGRNLAGNHSWGFLPAHCP